MKRLVAVWSSLGRGVHLADPDSKRTLCGRDASWWSWDDNYAITCRTCRRKGANR